MSVGSPEFRETDVVSAAMRGALPDRHELFRNARILVVDDVETNVRVLRRMLHEAGVGEVVATTDPREVVDRCRERRPDLVMLDLHMPHRSGIEVMNDLRELVGAGD